MPTTVSIEINKRRLFRPGQNIVVKLLEVNEVSPGNIEIKGVRLPTEVEKPLNPLPGPSMMTVGQAARYLGMHVNTLRRYSDKGVIRAFYIGDRKDRRYHKSDLDDYINKGR